MGRCPSPKFHPGEFRESGHQDAPKTSQQVYAAVPEADRQEFRTALEALLALEKSGD